MLTECTQCREPITEDQEKCPACGTPNRSYRTRGRPMLWVGIGVVILVAVLEGLLPGLGSLAVLGIVTVVGLFMIYKAGPLRSILWVVGSVLLFGLVYWVMGYLRLPVPPSLVYAAAAVGLLNTLERF
ncbi:MAG TPA: hypothetical protein VFM29_09840 [Vicinamibacteria bacterium]|nr:hypothetical protein [Vicinamibacteria bacterium]